MLNKQLAPRGERPAVLDFDAEANALVLAQLSDTEKIGSAAVKIECEIGCKLGIDWFADDGVPTHTAVTASDNGTYTIATGAVGTVGDVR